MVGKHLLITRNNRQTLHKRALNDMVCRLGIVNKLYDKVHLWVREYIVSIICKLSLYIAWFAQIAHADMANLDIV